MIAKVIRHRVEPVFMASGYHWCRVCAKSIKARGDWWVHTPGMYDSNWRSR